MKFLISLVFLVVSFLYGDNEETNKIESTLLVLVQGKSDIYVVNRINTEINRYKYISDKRNYLKKDYWATAQEFFSNKGGDCEDFAVAKASLLLASGVVGIDDLAINITTLRSGVKHATLVVKLKGAYLELDNMKRIPVKYNKTGTLVPYKEVLRRKYS